MVSKNYISTRKHTNLKGIILYYQGPISQKIIENEASRLKEKLSSIVKPATLLKIFSVFIEQTQNILHYGQPEAEGDPLSREGILLIEEEKQGHYTIIAGNPISATQKELLEKQLNMIARMDRPQMIEEYRKRIHTSLYSERDGAGVGLLLIAKTAAVPIEFNFIPGKRDSCYYYLKVTIAEPV